MRYRRSLRDAASLGVVLAWSSLLAACGGTADPTGQGSWGESATGEPTSQGESALAAYPNSLWSPTNYVVTICYVESGLATAKARLQNALTETWGANSGLKFVWPSSSNDVCPESPAGSGNVSASYMPIHLHVGVGVDDWGGSCQPGYGGRQAASNCGGTVSCQCQFSTADGTINPDAYLRGVAIHEIGHGLGLPHEHQRIDRPSNISSTCVDPNNATADWTSGGNYQILTDLILLTKYDGTLSIMSYCRDFDQNGVWDNPPYPVLSVLDGLGIEMMYPKNYGRKPVLSGFANSDGSQYIVRSDIPTTLNVDWVWRGGLTSSLHNVQWENQAGTVLSSSPSASVTISSAETIKVQLDDAFGRHHPWTQTTATPSNARHASIVMSASVVL